MRTLFVSKPPLWFWTVAVLALVWNVMGLVAVGMNFMITPEQLAAMPIDQQQLYAETPAWASYGSLLAVLAGCLGCVGMLIKQSWAVHAFTLSIVGLIIQNIGLFLIVDAASVVGDSVILLQGGVALIAIILYFMAQHACKQQWLK
ncbi:MAG: hypothetical protein WA981_06655 [Glaciecola sp.]